MSIDTRKAYLDKTVTPRISNIQGNREMLRTRLTCFDPNDPTRMPWYGNVTENVSDGDELPDGGSLINRTASWSINMNLRGYNVDGAADFWVNADFPAETAAYGVSTTLPVHSAEDPAPCTPLELALGTCPSPSYYVIDLAFSSTEPTLSPMDACSRSGVTFTYEHNSTFTLHAPNSTILQEPACANGMVLRIDVKPSLICMLDPELCGATLGATYTIYAAWTETSVNPPAETGTVLHEPVIYSYDPKECSMPN
ncbi:TPA: hypothetical protein EYP38_00625 [Candidatus Micrarchaeota archaeon]|nr:hypothetical protein [Candidatus Micrarchaeota archaeon]